MTLFFHELRQNRIALCVWTAAIAFMLLICMIMFPEMNTDMEGLTDMFSNMGSFTRAFGMDRLNFGDVMGFYAIECGNILSIGGGFFAALLGINALAKEEKEKTAEFLLTHPIHRRTVIFQKLLAVIFQLIIMNLLVMAVSAASFALIGEEPAVREFLLLHAAYTILQLEIASICFGISAFLRHNGVGAGLGLAALLYFLNIFKNISKQAAFLKYITPFAYAEAADIIADSAIDMKLLALGIFYAAIGIGAAFAKYTKKDIVA